MRSKIELIGLTVTVCATVVVGALFYNTPANDILGRLDTRYCKCIAGANATMQGYCVKRLVQVVAACEANKRLELCSTQTKALVAKCGTDPKKSCNKSKCLAGAEFFNQRVATDIMTSGHGYYRALPFFQKPAVKPKP